MDCCILSLTSSGNCPRADEDEVPSPETRRPSRTQRALGGHDKTHLMFCWPFGENACS